MRKNQSCNDWLKKLLSDGEIHLIEEVRKAADAEGFSRVGLKRARKEVGVKTFHQFDEDGATENWFWYLEDFE